jgi:hypothetical protein
MKNLVRIFDIAILYNSQYLWARVVEHYNSPAIFHIAFQDHSEIDVPSEIVLDTKNSKIIPAGNSMPTKDEVLKLVTAEIEEHFRQHYLS